MTPLQHYRDLWNKFRSLDDINSAEASILLHEMEVAWVALTDDEKNAMLCEIGI